MPLIHGIELTYHLRLKYPEIRVLILTGSAGEDDLVKAIHARASSYILKDSSIAELGVAVRAAAAGEFYVTPRRTRPLLRTHSHNIAKQTTAKQIVRLKPCQREILNMLVAGRLNKETATELCVSVKTEDKHHGELMQRLDVQNAASLVQFALQNGLAN